MSGRTIYITPQKWGKLKKNYAFAPYAKKIESLVDVNDRYVANIESDLRNMGEHRLAEAFIETVEDRSEYLALEPNLED